MFASAFKLLMTPARGRAAETSPSATARSLRFAALDDKIPEVKGGVKTPPGSPPSGYARTLPRNEDAAGVTDRSNHRSRQCLDLQSAQDLGVVGACGPPQGSRGKEIQAIQGGLPKFRQGAQGDVGEVQHFDHP